jgi:hypothetical protein
LVLVSQRPHHQLQSPQKLSKLPLSELPGLFSLLGLLAATTTSHQVVCIEDKDPLEIVELEEEGVSRGEHTVSEVVPQEL